MNWVGVVAGEDSYRAEVCAAQARYLLLLDSNLMGAPLNTRCIQKYIIDILTGIGNVLPEFDTSHICLPCEDMLVNHGPSYQSSKEEYKPWK